MKFLLLRPQAKCQASAEAFKKANIDAVGCGLIDTILDDNAIALLPEKIAELNLSSNKNSYVMVTSTVAATQTTLLKDLWPKGIQFFAVGKSTGSILQQAGINPVIPTEARTEGLLSLPQLRDITNKTIVIMKGFGGRELLHDTLVDRGADVQEWEVYKRIKVAQPISTERWQAEQIHSIIATSGEVIEAAFEYFDQTWLKTLNWIVVSQRTADIAAKLGVSQIEICRDASDKALIQCAQDHMTRARHSLEH